MSIPSDIKILIVEDDDMTMNELVTDLKELGIKNELVLAKNGEEAKNIYLTEANIGFIISDMVMPVMSGYDFLVYIRTELGDKKTPFLMLTSKSDNDVVVKCVKAGVTNYLVKPWKSQSLSEKLMACWNKVH
jgi:CheY-like chemotaxis protein